MADDRLQTREIMLQDLGLIGDGSAVLTIEAAWQIVKKELDASQLHLLENFDDPTERGLLEGYRTALYGRLRRALYANNQSGSEP